MKGQCLPVRAVELSSSVPTLVRPIYNPNYNDTSLSGSANHCLSLGTHAEFSPNMRRIRSFITHVIIRY